MTTSLPAAKVRSASLVPHGQHRRGWSAHETNCIGVEGFRGTARRYGLPPQAKSHAIRPPVLEGSVASNLRSMPDTDGRFPDDVPVADAVEQQRSTGEFPPTTRTTALPAWSRMRCHWRPLFPTGRSSSSRSSSTRNSVIVGSKSAAHRFSASALSRGRSDLFQWPAQIPLH